jgi:hypothetical protein
MTQIAALSEGGARPFLEKAHTLLTRAWSRADWRMREQLLKTAAWLIDLQAHEARLAAQGLRQSDRPDRPGTRATAEFTNAAE